MTSLSEEVSEEPTTRSVCHHSVNTQILEDCQLIITSHPAVHNEPYDNHMYIIIGTYVCTS